MRRGGLAVGRLLGFEIRVAPTWAILLAIVVLLASEQAALAAPGATAALQWLLGLAVAAAFLASVLAHELAHAVVARRRGVATESVTLGFVGGIAPVDIEARRPDDELAIAVVGPVVSLVLAALLVAAGLLLSAADPAPAGGTASAVGVSIVVVGGLNLLLALLSLLPGLPLDGGRIVRALAWRTTGDTDRATGITARTGRMAGWVTAALGMAVALLDRPMEGLVVISLAWVLSTGAHTLDRRLGVERLLRGIPVRDAMERDVPRVAPYLTVDTFSRGYEGPDGVRSLPVVAGDQLLGVIGLSRVRRLGRRTTTTRASEVMATPPDAPFLAPDDPLWAALDVLQRTGLDGLAVAEDGRLAGMLTKRGIATVVRDRLAAVKGATG